ncbi:hypothetical protein ASPVEDRAFT_677669 [Aspergillus versicolor CBS 583.65]|uniref:Uncharacterized protein n=1 Tax=Aspergillus versicolor CBS 583.65 TaxID=1036611 RepID=A0A1L9PM57_ASPVE|nr:uncharacterized protein ASPVEDRAFT_677669 [Aspergillus versicolor CBS 583.65]OJJ02505.1 hypothetical protein ASPVEDRAFT_677669 [Aspergillus versicolor CBS 583.65]
MSAPSLVSGKLTITKPCTNTTAGSKYYNGCDFDTKGASCAQTSSNATFSSVVETYAIISYRQICRSPLLRS